MMVMNPYPGFEGRYFSMPCRNVVPKPVQKPHPPIWVACSKRETIHLAARCGIGALTFAFVDAPEAKQWVDDYYETFKRECVPIGHAVNPNVAMVTGFSVHEDEFIAGTPAQVAEQIIAQCRGCGAGHFLAILGRAVDEHRIRAVELFGEQVIPILRRAEIA